MCRTVFWTLWEREKVGWLGRMALKHVYYHVRNELPVYVWYRILEAGARGWSREMIWGGRWEGGSGLGTHVHLWLIHFNVWQNQYSIVKQNKVKIKIGKKKFPGDSAGKESACQARDLGSIPGSGWSPGGGHGSPLHYSCLENPMDRGAWQVAVHGATKGQTQQSN